MKTRVVKFVRTIAVASLAAGIQACGCDGVACIDGLIVNLNSQPAASFKIELLVAGVVQDAPEEATCEVGATRPCGNSALFRVRPRDNVSVRVTTSAGVRTTTYPAITYLTSGSVAGCNNCKGQAQITAIVP